MARDADSDTLTYRFNSEPSNGTATINGNTVTYQANSGYVGNDSFTFIANDGTTDSNTATITITVSAPEPENNAPVANDSNENVISGEVLTITLVATDADGDTLTYRFNTEPSNGTATINGNIVTYQASDGYAGSDSFTFIVNDGFEDSNIANVTITVVALGDTTTLHDGSIVITADLVAIGNLLYHDTNLSEPAGQSCASCHDLNTGFDDPNTANPSSIGADGVSFGTRNSPTASYAAHIPAPSRDGRRLVGGLFLDGRAESLEEQAKGPFTNPVEMANASNSDVIGKISDGTYANDFENLFGEAIFDDSELSFNYVADAIAAFERSDVFSPFSSKFDRVQAGEDTFSAAEARGENIFNNKGDCRRCHHTDNGAEMFSDFQYENIGVPSNPQLPAVIADNSFVDLGLGEQSGDNRENGQFRTPTLRNIANTAPYMHNGVFNTLREVIDFYNTRDTTFPDAPEVPQNVDQGGRIGELGLTNNEINDLIAFLETLTDE